MPNRIAGITVEISGDTTKLNKALEIVNGTIKGTQNQLKDVEKLLKLDPTNTELLAQKQSLLTNAVSASTTSFTSTEVGEAMEFMAIELTFLRQQHSFHH